VNVVKIVTACVIVLCAVCNRESRKLKRIYQVVDVSFTVQKAIGGFCRLVEARDNRQPLQVG
jgi:hypothetical protein